MSLSLALSSALSGIALSARGTQIVANNIANARTEAYGVRVLTQAARVLGGMGSGVVVTGIDRQSNPALIAELRTANANASRDLIKGTFWKALEAGIGLPGEPGSLSHAISRLDTALHQASAAPDQQAVLQHSVQAAADITQKLRDLNFLVQAERDRADAAIERDVNWLNHALESIAELNLEIQRQSLLGGEPEGLMDTRQALVDKVSELIPLREFPREDGRIMIMGADGTILVDRTAARFSFSRTPEPSANERVEDGALSPLRLNGRAIAASSPLLASGQIGSNFSIRDEFGPEMQDTLDRLAIDLVLRFASPEIDPSLSPGEMGLFNLEGVTTIPSDINGLAGRIRLNPALDPNAGGETWRLRDGVNASTPGPVADNSILDRMIHAVQAPSMLQDMASPARYMQGHATDLVATITTHRLQSDLHTGQSTARVSTLQEYLATQGVDTDAELSRLLTLEQAYAANARVIASVDAMLRTILEI